MLIIPFAVWCFYGAIFLGMCRVKVPMDTIYGKENPVEAWAAWLLMLGMWPLTAIRRKQFARYGEPKDENNPTWLSQS